MTDPQDDTVFAEYMDGDSPVSRRYAALESEEPAAQLDAEILAAARRAASPNVIPLKQPPRRWMMPVTLAATIVLSFSLVMSIVFETPNLIDTVPVTTTSEETISIERDVEDAVAEKSLERKVASPPTLPSRPKSVIMSDTPPQGVSDTSPHPADGRVGLAQKNEVAQSAAGADDVAAATSGVTGGMASSAQSLDGVSRDTSWLLAALRELVPSKPNGQTTIPIAKESRQRRDDGMKARFEPEIRPTTSEAQRTPETKTDADAADPQADRKSDRNRELQWIVVLFELGDDEAALEALEKFSRSWPDHPASRIYLDWL